MNDSNFPRWLQPPLPKNIFQKKGSKKLNQTKIIRSGLGKQLSQSDVFTRKDFMRGFAFQLHNSLQERALELLYLHDYFGLSIVVQNKILDFYSLINEKKLLIWNFNKVNVKEVLSRANEIESPLKEFCMEIETLAPQTATGLLLLCIVEELIEDVKHYVKSIQITYQIKNVVGGRIKIPNRPTNDKAKIIFNSIIFEHQEYYGYGLYPKTEEVKRLLIMAECNVPERTLRDWKKQHIKGTLMHFIQNRNGNN
jgi:hypothetical protein